MIDCWSFLAGVFVGVALSGALAAIILWQERRLLASLSTADKPSATPSLQRV
jgi:hypothetical protein